VVNYLLPDTQRQPPTIQLSASIALNQTTKTGSVEEGKPMRLSAAVTDDVQVRNVEFYIDGQLASIDGNFPFDHRFITPDLTATRTSFTVRAKATDTGGNSTWSDTFQITLTPDATPPQILSFSPADAALTGALKYGYVTFNEPMKPESLASAIRWTEAGLDKLHGTADDVSVPFSLTYQENINMALLSVIGSPLSPGSYRLSVGATALDAAGNALGAIATSTFRVYNAGLDSDGDEIPDDFEVVLGLDPTKADTDGNGTPDGREDYDHDGLSNAAEFYAGRNPKVADTDGDGILDGAEDEDGDGMTDQAEFAAGTNPNSADTDGDGLDDGSEIAEGTDPLLPTPFTRVYYSDAVAFANESAAVTETQTMSFVSAPVAFVNEPDAVPSTAVITILSLPTAYRNQPP
jgi:hypothetical protein